MSTWNGRGAETQRTYGGRGRHAIPGNGVRVIGTPNDVRKIIRRARGVDAVQPLTFDTLDIDPNYVGKHRADVYAEQQEATR
jgi:hypothetical protein